MKHTKKGRKMFLRDKQENTISSLEYPFRDIYISFVIWKFFSSIYAISIGLFYLYCGLCNVITEYFAVT